jgi:uncharacterized membrane protein YwaF
MISIPHKTKQFLVLIIKVLIVGGAFSFTISWQIMTNWLGAIYCQIQKKPVGAELVFYYY